MSPNKSDVLVLFSGGRDSSLVACLLASQGANVHLLTCNNGVSIGCDLSAYRYNEIKSCLSSRIVGRTIVSTMGLFRRIALANIEQDFERFHKNLIVLGSQLAIHTEAVIYCRNRGLAAVASGFTAYQSSFAEQMPAAITRLTSFLREFDIDYATPISGYQSADEVKYRLLDFGVSTKSLEAVSIFSDTFSDPTSDQVLAYLEAKLPVCRDYISLKCGTASQPE